MSQAAVTQVTLKSRFPFRLGTTSYIIPADIIPNVRFPGPLIDDIELFFLNPMKFPTCRMKGSSINLLN